MELMKSCERRVLFESALMKGLLRVYPPIAILSTRTAGERAIGRTDTRVSPPKKVRSFTVKTHPFSTEQYRPVGFWLDSGIKSTLLRRWRSVNAEGQFFRKLGFVHGGGGAAHGVGAALGFGKSDDVANRRFAGQQRHQTVQP